ncbi:hypothetical protein ACIQC5_07750 [Paenarthrobacter sp. NPDC092416]|uniref:hypothetical protein n=1 Tax=Paenarthrobacter sp. NPDC092416 TaxID=3364386 RepID=UPI0038224A1D
MAGPKPGNGDGQEVQIRFNERGLPLAVRHEGILWTVDPNSVDRRDPWSRDQQERPANQGGHAAQRLEWQLVVRRSGTLVFAVMDLALDQYSGMWRLTGFREDS